MPGYELHALNKPMFGRIKIVDQGHFCVMVDSTGYVEPTSYCAALKTLKALGFERESQGMENGQSFEVWRLPEDRQTQKDDIGSSPSDR